ncbi:hypothetical protein AERO8C_140221 [Aeromonas veronii]|uniref:Uncharacterized protein n=1 Tax=Aeromonas veronii TaxID=654 RepID=A0A653KTU9_AERVE|nr:hypothetical protein AERO8C_140221 [Aeromonas veronii]
MQLAALLLAEGLGTGLHFGQQPLYRDGGDHLIVAIAGEQQDVVDLLLQILQTGHQLLLKLSARFRLEGAVGQVGGIEHGSGERRADLVGKRGRHIAQRRQPLHVVDAVLQFTGFGQVIDKNQLAGLIRQRLGRELDPAPVAQGNLVAIILPRLEAAGNDVTPELPFQRLPQQGDGRRIRAGDHPCPVKQQHPGGERLEDGIELAHFVGLEWHVLLLDCHKPDLKLAIGSGYSISMPLNYIN